MIDIPFFALYIYEYIALSLVQSLSICFPAVGSSLPAKIAKRQIEERGGLTLREWIGTGREGLRTGSDWRGTAARR